jgi:hypothetical protein
VVCDLENLKNEEAMTRGGSQRHRKKKVGGTSPAITQLDHETEYLSPTNVAWDSSFKAASVPPWAFIIVFLIKNRDNITLIIIIFSIL